MSDLACCGESAWIPELDLDHAGGFEFTLGKCGRCGAQWMSVFCVASGIGGHERVKPDDAGRMRSLPAGPERKAFMRAWADRNI
jgi:hypothetical protein